MYITEWIRKSEKVKTVNGEMTAKQWCFAECERIKKRTDRTPKVVKMRNPGGYVSYRVKDNSIKIVKVGTKHTATIVPATDNETKDSKPRWTVDEIDTLIMLHGEGRAVKDIANKMGRTANACYCKLKTMND